MTYPSPVLSSLIRSRQGLLTRTNEIEIDGGITAHKIYSLDDDWTMNHETARLLITPITPYEGVIRITCR